MNVLRTFVPNSQANYNHLVYCESSREAAAIDPYDAEHLITLANNHNLVINQIWITHEHGDHIRDMKKLKALTGSEIYAPVSCQGKFQADHWLVDQSDVALGHGNVTHLLVPGHTPGHGIFLYKNETDPATDFIICGDTLFNAGVGNVYSGDAEILFNSIESLKTHLTPTTRLYPGHDYLLTNLNFTQSLYCDPIVTKLITEISAQTPNTRSIMTWQDELTYNLFLQLQSEHVAAIAKQQGNEQSTPLERFICLRHLRDQW